MPTYTNANLILNLTYSSTQPATSAIYKDANGIKYTVIAVNGTGASANYAVTTLNSNPTLSVGPALGTLNKVSGTGDAAVTLNSYTQNPPAIVGFTRIEPGATVTTTEWLITNPWYVPQTSTSPYLDNTIYSTKLTSTTTVIVPATVIDSTTGNSIPLLTNYKVRAYVGVGDCTIQINSPSSIARNVGLYDTWECYCSTRVVQNVIVTISSGTIYFSIEKL